MGCGRAIQRDGFSSLDVAARATHGAPGMSNDR
jgi:hypothetical protein